MFGRLGVRPDNELVTRVISPGFGAFWDVVPHPDREAVFLREIDMEAKDLREAEAEHVLSL